MKKFKNTVKREKARSNLFFTCLCLFCILFLIVSCNSDGGTIIGGGDNSGDGRTIIGGGDNSGDGRTIIGGGDNSDDAGIIIGGGDNSGDGRTIIGGGDNSGDGRTIIGGGDNSDDAGIIIGGGDNSGDGRTIIGGGDNSDDGGSVLTPLVVDKDGNGLIEIDNLTKLDNIRYNTLGTSYKTSSTDTGSTEGCPSGGCNGYELTENLNFDKDGDGSTWTESSGVYSLDADDSTSYFNTSNINSGGWQAIPSFSAIFEGNGHMINNLAAISSNVNLGLFGEVTASAEVRNLHITRAFFKNNSTAGTDINFITTGILAGRSSGSITAVITTGVIVANNGNYDNVGGLVGYQGGGSITASYATGKCRWRRWKSRYCRRISW